MRMAGSAMQNLFADMGSPDFTKMSNMGQQARADEGIMAMKSDAMVDNSKMAGAAKVAMADMQAGAIEAQGQAAQQAAIGNAIGQIGGIAAGRAAAAAKAPIAIQGLVDMAGSFGGDYAGMYAGDAIMRAKDKLFGGEGLNPYERMGKKEQEAYAEQIEQDTLMKLGLLNPTRQEYLADLGIG